MPKKVCVGQVLFLSKVGEDNKVTTRKVYVIECNHSSIYLGYHIDDIKMSYQPMRIKTSGNFPEVMRPNYVERYYVSDDCNYGDFLEKDISRRIKYKRSIKKNMNNLLYGDHDTEDYKKVAEFLDGILR